MSGKRDGLEEVYGLVPQDPRDRVKAGSGKRWSCAGNAMTTFTPGVYSDTSTKDETLESRMN
jgi:hypothetical protein